MSIHKNLAPTLKYKGLFLKMKYVIDENGIFKLVTFLQKRKKLFHT